MTGFNLLVDPSDGGVAFVWLPVSTRTQRRALLKVGCTAASESGLADVNTLSFSLLSSFDQHGDL